MAKPEKYALYEESVQSPKHDADWLVSLYKDIRGKYPISLREDFCGTASLACEWVKRSRHNRAIGLDLDPEPLAYGRKHHWAQLSTEQKARLKVARKNVIAVTRPGVDMIAACNFSYCIFKDRDTLVKYFSCARKSLAARGLFFVDLAGGPGMIQKHSEKRAFFGPQRKRRFSYVWDQKSFDPVTHYAQYAIHFEFPDGTRMRNAFTYDWRLWTIPEVKDAMRDAGFKRTEVYWELEKRGQGTGQYVRSEHGSNDHSWIAFVVGVK